jgi:hypothetical protein
MLLTWVPFARRVWALPFLTLLAPSEREGRHTRPKPIGCGRPAANTKLAAQAQHVFVGDAGYAVFDLLWRMARSNIRSQW